VGTLTIGGNLNIAGNLSMALNKSLAVSNSSVSMTNIFTSTSGSINYTSGSLQLINVGPTLKVGDRFVLFSKPVAGMSVGPMGNFTVNNNLAVDGSVTVATVAQPPAAKINKITVDNANNAIITATNNFGPGGSWDLIATNNLKAPITTWPVVLSGSFG